MEIKDRILSKADTICRKIGFRAMTLDFIATDLGISKKTIYQYFKDKDELVDSIMNLEIENTKNDCLVCQDASENAVDEFFLMLEAMAQDMKDTNPIILHDLQKFHFSTFTKLMNLKKEFFYDLISTNLKRGIEEGLFLTELDIDVLTKLRMESMFLFLQQEVFPTDQYDFLKVNEIITKHFLYGILTDKGRQILSKYLK